MASYGVAEARDNFTRMLARVEAGETVTITRHGKVVAEVAAPSPKAKWPARKARLLEIAALADNAALLATPGGATSLAGTLDAPADRYKVASVLDDMARVRASLTRTDISAAQLIRDIRDEGL